MSGQEVFIFGSFTEEESRFFQNQSAMTNVDQTEKICLQFGSLSFAFESTVKGSSAKADDKADITQACELVAKSSASKNGTGAISKALHKIPQSKVNESPNGSLFHTDIIEKLRRILLILVHQVYLDLRIILLI
ncbi:uncharacterized protein LOC120263100 [Dioscorea cayenensis subsp. rotundata]|uniref:Uncharacterized protein LOC120263100 n=1 Tax=Dioscorea cayennensis subsp. rotundata TaxID=55577 RepID=A0AB40BJ27_DIOCR|nr:uncharacterized protein LOC120263100 [Dioscorea cayenensis subsp. rotundata]